MGPSTRKRCPRFPKLCSASPGSPTNRPGSPIPAAALGLTGHLWNENGDGCFVSGLIGDVVQGVTGSAEVDAGVFMDTFNKWISPARLAVTQFKDCVGLAHDLPKFVLRGRRSRGRGRQANPGRAS